jgi:hypothetical protein
MQEPMNAADRDYIPFVGNMGTPDLGVRESSVQISGECPVPPSAPLVPKPSVSKLVVSPGTPLACTGCHRVGMPLYYLKRSNGKYDVLCFDNGKGCWEHSGVSLCTYIDDEAQCTDLAEFLVTYGEETDLVRRAVCSRHVPAVLNSARSYRVYPIDDFLGGGLVGATVGVSHPGA